MWEKGHHQVASNPMSNSITSFDEIPGELVIAMDTEFEKAETLLIQTACRLSESQLAVQVYQSQLVPAPSECFSLDHFVAFDDENYGRFAENLQLRPLKFIARNLSPARMLRDLLEIPLHVYSRAEGKAQQDWFGDTRPRPVNVTDRDKRGRWVIPSVTVRQVVHFQAADFLRVFGRDFFDELIDRYYRDRGEVAIQDGKRIRYVECQRCRDFNDPVVEYIETGDGRFYGVRLATLDTILPFGPGSLDQHSQTFLRLRKSDALSIADKQHMRRTILEKTDEAYGDAITDPINTLLIQEEMKKQNDEIFRSFGFSARETPTLRATVGARVCDVITRTAVRAATGSELLSSQRALKELMERGGREPFQNVAGGSRFGEQNAHVHGGLLFSRSPATFWHEALKMLRDVDLGGCYNKIVGDMNVYFGRPIVFEPGRHRMTLRAAVELVTQHSPRDGWFIRVTGDITTIRNALIPSTRNALTTENYTSRTAKRRARTRSLCGFELEYLRVAPDSGDDQGAKLYSGRIESGVVTHATWLMCQALPDAARLEYENLVAEAIVFYPNRLIAGDGPQYDSLRHDLETEELPWESVLDLDRGHVLHTEHLDANYVSLRYSISDVARQIGGFREAAQREHGKKSGLDSAWKQLANSMFGVLACEDLSTFNPVAANQVTAVCSHCPCNCVWDDDVTQRHSGHHRWMHLSARPDSSLEFCRVPRTSGRLSDSQGQLGLTDCFSGSRRCSSRGWRVHGLVLRTCETLLWCRGWRIRPAVRPALA